MGSRGGMIEADSPRYVPGNAATSLVSVSCTPVERCRDTTRIAHQASTPLCCPQQTTNHSHHSDRAQLRAAERSFSFLFVILLLTERGSSPRGTAISLESKLRWKRDMLLLAENKTGSWSSTDAHARPRRDRFDPAVFAVVRVQWRSHSAPALTHARGAIPPPVTPNPEIRGRPGKTKERHAVTQQIEARSLYFGFAPKRNVIARKSMV